MANYKDKKEARRELGILKAHLSEITSERFLLPDYLTVGSKDSNRCVYFDPQSKQGKYLLEAIELRIRKQRKSAKIWIQNDSCKGFL